MANKKSVTALKGLIRKPVEAVAIDMMNPITAPCRDQKISEKCNKTPSYTLAELLAQCDPNAPVPEDAKAWMEVKPVGKERF